MGGLLDSNNTGGPGRIRGLVTKARLTLIACNLQENLNLKKNLF